MNLLSGSENCSKGQAAIEYMMIFGFAIALSTPFIVKAQGSILELRTSSQIMDVRNSVDRIERAAQTVNAAGPPARRTFTIDIPEIVDSSFLLDSAIVYQVRTSDGRTNITRSFDFNISGTLPSDGGAHRLSVSAKSDHIELEEVP